MFVFLKHVWHSFWDSLPYTLPALSNLILVVAGAVMSLPELATKVEVKYKRLFGVVCIVAGLIGFIFDVDQRRRADQSNKTLMSDMETTVNNTGTIVNSTNNAVNLIALTVVPMMTSLSSRVSDLEQKVEASKGDPHLIAALKAQAEEAKQQGAAASRQVALTMAPGIILQLRDVANYWNLFDEKATLPIDLTQAQKSQQRATIAQEYQGKARPLLVTADYLRQLLLQQLSTPQTEDDKREAVTFAKAVAGQPFSLGELFSAIGYLQKLSGRVTSNSH